MPEREARNRDRIAFKTKRNTMSERIFVRTYASPCGNLLLGTFQDKLCLCNWTEALHPGRVEKRLQAILNSAFTPGETELAREAARQLDAYFKKEQTTFDLPLLPAGTVFQKKIWRLLQEIPYGETRSYGELAKRAGCPQAARAVANAVGANPISILVPCHRVVGSDHALTGFGGGLPAKKFLLDLESGILPLRFPD